MTAVANRMPMRFAGFPIGAWAFAWRTWLSLVLALYAAFWLQLESPATSALTVAVLAFPWRGQGLEKAAYRVFATVIGLIASIAIVGLFSQTGWLLIAILGAWVGACVYASSLFDGFRSYAAVLCIITVCLIAVEPLDTPQSVFELAHERGAAILIGILSVTVVNDFLFAPDYFPTIAGRLEALHRKVSAVAASSMHGVGLPSEDVAALLRAITALRPDVTSLGTETSVGPARSAAARTAMVDLVVQLEVSRSVAALTASPSGGVDDSENKNPAPPTISKSTSKTAALALNWMKSELLRRDRNVATSIRALRRGTTLENARRSPFYRSHRIALENGIRAFAYFVLSAIALAIAGWPSTSVALAFVGILIGLAAMSPNQSAATTLALVAVPIGCLLAGVLEFVVLDGVTAFPLLAIGLLPFIMLPALLLTMPNPALVSFGRGILVFTIAVFAPSNPQTYNPQTFLFACMFLSISALLLFVCQHVFPPLSTAGKLQILLSEARRDILMPVTGTHSQRERDEALFRDAVRVGQIVSAAGTENSDAPLIEEALACFDRAAALRLADSALGMLPPDTPVLLRETAMSAVRDADSSAMLAAAEAMICTETEKRCPTEDAASALAAAANLLGLTAANTEKAK
ncbi:FUSC family protein [Hyphomicrobium facile]|uniref:Uncharacterized membrane protein YccC n=1 Tax=Hyphomicrobium facile TaxID=51670 RepID=A0A1I7NR44_9HYPH|nr:FUSC family protein [Hyphomicrobium facile]SFV37070.1 Uncharacterized membrane protein YccC [Hyphomicrobium facile]